MIPLNLVTGFLGVGKTTLIRHLLQQVPAGERWAVLVNEFGEIGVDQALLEHANADQNTVSIEEVAGGCLCCVAAPAFTVGLNRLIRQAKPTRLLIEPSGLGHPAQILEQLRSPLYANILDIRATLCVLDARHLSSPRHLENTTFNDQIHIADVLIGNKADTYTEQDRERLFEFVAQLKPSKQHLSLCEQGQVDPALLDLGSHPAASRFPEAQAFLLDQGITDPSTSPEPWLSIDGVADGFYRLGWQVSPHYRFQRDAVLDCLNGIAAERVKAQVQCAEAQLLYNRSSSDEAAISEQAGNGQTVIQLIDDKPFDRSALDQSLRACLIEG